jgi:hypothetical protein
MNDTGNEGNMALITGRELRSLQDEVTHEKISARISVLITAALPHSYTTHLRRCLLVLSLATVRI